MRTGSHLASLDAVANGTVDVAAIDCVTLAFARDHLPERLAALRQIGRTEAAPGLQLVSSRHTGPALSSAEYAGFHALQPSQDTGCLASSRVGAGIADRPGTAGEGSGRLSICALLLCSGARALLEYAAGTTLAWHACHPQPLSPSHLCLCVPLPVC
ncbi:hypothetical protein [Cupriavidus sp. YAF13]|uniref:hypothetical protein n=1 Tax=Cupriavidus sp. YAF13 TaxID=3233075 RepID=UPI003F8F8E9D